MRRDYSQLGVDRSGASPSAHLFSFRSPSAMALMGVAAMRSRLAAIASNPIADGLEKARSQPRGSPPIPKPSGIACDRSNVRSLVVVGGVVFSTEPSMSSPCSLSDCWLRFERLASFGSGKVHWRGKDDQPRKGSVARLGWSADHQRRGTTWVPPQRPTMRRWRLVGQVCGGWFTHLALGHLAATADGAPLVTLDATGAASQTTSTGPGVLLAAFDA